MWLFWGLLGLQFLLGILKIAGPLKKWHWGIVAIPGIIWGVIVIWGIIALSGAFG